MGRLLPAHDGRSLPRVANGDPVAGARALVDFISAAIAVAEALEADLVAGHLAMALKAAERRASEEEQVKDTP